MILKLTVDGASAHPAWALVVPENMRLPWNKVKPRPYGITSSCPARIGGVPFAPVKFASRIFGHCALFL